MPIGPRGSLLVIILLSSGVLVVNSACVLLALKFKQTRSRPYLFSSCFFLLQSLGIIGPILLSLLNGQGNYPFDRILRPADLIKGFLTIIFLLCYIVDIKTPGKLTFKTILIGISPFITASVMLFLAHPSQLHSLEEVFTGITRPDVWLRLVIVFFLFAYPIAVACLSYEWSQCLVSRHIVTGLHILSCLVIPAFVAGMMCGYFPAIIVNYILALVIDFLVIYIELKVRIPLTERQDEKNLPGKTRESFFDNPEIWMNPDMTVTELARLMGTNHTYLLQRIKDLGYSSYPDMINRKRVEYICKGLQEERPVNIINLMYDAGFRSRSTASREFKRIVGCTPSDYLESVSKAR